MRFHILLSFVTLSLAEIAGPTLAPREFTTVVNGTVAQDIAVSPKGGWAYIVGSTLDPNYPTTPDAFDRTCGTDGVCNPVQTRYGTFLNADVVLTLIDSEGKVRYSTFLGGAGYDDNPRIAVARNGTVWLVGHTSSSAFEGYAGSCAGAFWIARFDFTLKHLQQLRCYPWDLAPADIQLDVQARLWVLGTTTTPDIATPNAYQRQIAGFADMFLACFTDDEVQPQYATYLGGRLSDRASALAIAPSGAVAITGETTSHDFPIVRAFKDTLREDSPVDGDAVIAVLDPGGQLLQFSTYWGGSRYDAGRGVAIDTLGNVYVTGETQSSDMPSTDAAYHTSCRIDGTLGRCFDAFIAKFSTNGTLLASTFFGGGDLDNGRAVQLSTHGRVILIGGTQSSDFPLVNAPPSARTPGVNFEHTFLAVFDDNLSALRHSGFVQDQQFRPNVGVLSVRDDFGFVAGQVGPGSGMSSGIGTYVRAIHLP